MTSCWPGRDITRICTRNSYWKKSSNGHEQYPRRRGARYGVRLADDAAAAAVPVSVRGAGVRPDVDALNELFAAGLVTMINDFFLLVVMAGLLFKIDWRLAMDAMAILPFIFVVTLVFRKYVRDANRKIRTAIARINSFLQEYISGMSVVQLFNREQKARSEFARRNQANMLAWRDAILAYALFYPAVEFLSVAAIALIYWSGGNRVLAGALSLR